MHSEAGLEVITVEQYRENQKMQRPFEPKPLPFESAMKSQLKELECYRKGWSLADKAFNTMKRQYTNMKRRDAKLMAKNKRMGQ